MTKTRAWPVKVMYMLIAAALAISLIIIAAPALKVDAADEVEAKWTRVATPTMKGLVLGPESIIIDYAIADGGEVAYAIVDGWYLREGEYESDYWLLKSENGAATWDDLNDELEKLLDKGDYIDELVQVATDGDDPDFLAVALWWYDDSEGDFTMSVFISDDGGATFDDEPGEVEDGGVYFDDPDKVFDLAISPAEEDERNIAIGGTDWNGDSALFRCHVDGGRAGRWEDATEYDGWDDDGAFSSEAVTDIQFSPDWDRDHTILVITVTGDGPGEDVYLQSGTWGTVEAWNADAGFADAVPIVENKNIPLDDIDGFVAGITLPLDYSGKNTNTRYAWVWVNWYDSPDAAAMIFVVRNDDADPIGPMGEIEDGEVWLTNVDYLGYISEGKAIAGVLGDGTGDGADCCEGVQVYRNDGIANMDICCIPWEKACKPPTGVWAMEAFYVSDDPGESQAYAVALCGEDDYDEGAWSVSFDDGDVWNQLSLIDTQIDYLSDVAVSPDCNKTMAVSVNLNHGCKCDSVWLYGENIPEAGYSDYSGHWLRTWCGQLGDQQYGLLRLPAYETTGETVYLVDRGTDTIYLNEMETLACWDPVSSGPREIDEIVDMAVKDAETLFVLDDDGYVAMLDAEDWHKAVESKVDNGWTIAVWGDDILVGGQDGEVSHSADGGETFAELEKKPSIDGYVTVAFDSYFDTNATIYAAVIKECPSVSGGVYRWVAGESTKWKDLGAEPYGYTGLVLDNADGNPWTTADKGGVLYASYITEEAGKVVTGVARYLTPAEDVVCRECGDWDYLTVGLTADKEAFYFMPKALKICGCLTSDSNSKLFAIDGLGDYDMEEAKDGAVWMFEDCYAKKAPEATSPADGAVIAADPCTCFNVPFSLVWDRLCDACEYDIEFALDEEFTSIVEEASDASYRPSAGDAPGYHVSGGLLTCEFDYYWRVRAIEAGTGQVIRSWWSEPRKVTIAPAAGSGVTLPDRTGEEVPTTNPAFTWSEVESADEYDFVLSANADLSSPIVEEKGLTTTAYTYTGTLDHGTPYFYQISALKDGAVINTSPIGTFTTVEAAQYCHPETGKCFDTQAELEEYSKELREQSMKTPPWVWVVIAIGAVLVIVVIVLIFRTRRV